MGIKKSVEPQSKQGLRIPLDFKNTVLAALETKPEPRKRKASKNGKAGKEQRK